MGGERGKTVKAIKEWASEPVVDRGPLEGAGNACDGLRERAADAPTRTKNHTERDVLEELQMEGEEPEMICLLTK